jgi:hypothetical protein
MRSLLLRASDAVGIPRMDGEEAKSEFEDWLRRMVLTGRRRGALQWKWLTRPTRR